MEPSPFAKAGRKTHPAPGDAKCPTPQKGAAVTLKGEVPVMVFQALAIFFAWTWPIWAFVFVFCLVSAISRSVQEAADGKKRNSGKMTFWAAFSLAVILGGTASLLVMAG